MFSMPTFFLWLFIARYILELQGILYNKTITTVVYFKGNARKKSLCSILIEPVDVLIRLILKQKLGQICKRFFFPKNRTNLDNL